MYDAATYPYFLADADGDGKGDTKDGATVAYPNWSARLLKAAYNLQFSVKDPGAFVHNGKYIVELLHDSIEDLGGDVTKLAREDAGHFAGDSAWHSVIGMLKAKYLSIVPSAIAPPGCPPSSRLVVQ